MRISATLAVLGTTVLFAGGPRAASAGAFTGAVACEQTSETPPRYRLRFYFLDAHFRGELCEARLVPIAHDASPARTVLACSGPERLPGQVDTATGEAVYAAPTCLPIGWVFVDSVTVEVGAIPAYFRAEWIQGGQPTYGDILEFPCAVVVPTRSRTWGALKTSYR